jgi:hypothetical protein
MMSLPALSNWTHTRTGLHQAAQVLGAVRAVVAEPLPNWLHLALRIAPGQGLTTGDLPLGRLTLDFHTQAILYKAPGREEMGFALIQHTQQSMAETVEAALRALGHDLSLDRDKVVGDTPFSLDVGLAADYERVLSLAGEALARVREELPGQTSPLVVWPHGFDASFLWFATDQPGEDAPHMAFGFSPYSEGLERPYFYAYAHPVPDSLTRQVLPPLARWYTESWAGALLPYDKLIDKQDPTAAVANSLRQVYDTVSPLVS